MTRADLNNDRAFWRSYAAQMLSLARNAKTPRVKSVWLAGVARARVEMTASSTPAQRDLFS